MNRKIATRCCFAATCLSDALSLAALFKIRVVHAAVVAALAGVLAAAKYPLVEVVFFKINRKLFKFSILSLFGSMAVDFAVSAAVAYQKWGKNAIIAKIAAARLWLTPATLVFHVFFVLFMVAMKSLLIIDLTLPTIL